MPHDDAGVVDAEVDSAILPGIEAASDANSELEDSDALGRVCESNADCSGLHCVRSSDDLGIHGAGGPAHGYCTIDCTAQTRVLGAPDVCGPLGAFCLHFGASGTIAPAWCMKACALGPQPKCQARADLACALIGPRSLCVPVCAVNADCNGRRCDVATGLCDDDPVADSPIYHSCAAGLATTGCRGICAADYQPPAGQSAPGLCTRNCVVGSPNGCGAASGLPISGGTVGTCLGDNSGGPGDLGECYELCDSAADCADKDPGTTCDPFLQAVLGHGVCFPAAMPVADAGRTEASAPPVADAALLIDAAVDAQAASGSD